MFRTALLVLLMLGVPIAGFAQKQQSSTPKVTTTDTRNPQTPSTRRAPSISGQIFIEAPAPGFELDGSNGQPFRLSSTRGQWAVIVFADRWMHLDRLRQVEDGVRDLHVHVVGVCHEKAHTLLGVAERQKAPGLLLADVTGEISAMYGLYDFVRSETEPGVVVVDPEGIVRLAVIGQLPPAEALVSLTRYVITGL